MVLIGDTLRHDEASHIRRPFGRIPFVIQRPKVQKHFLEVQRARRLSVQPRRCERYPVGVINAPDTG